MSEVVNINVVVHVVVARTYSQIGNQAIAYDTVEREIGWFADAVLANQFISGCDNTFSNFRIIEKPALLIDGKYYKLEEMEVSE